jgi:hypothetical protein
MTPYKGTPIINTVYKLVSEKISEKVISCAGSSVFMWT